MIIKMAIILPTGQWYATSAVINDAWYCMVLHGIALYCIVLHGIAWFCMVLHGIAWYWLLHSIAWYVRYTCSKQMSPIIAFDIAVVAQKVKVQYYMMADMLNLKKWVLDR